MRLLALATVTLVVACQQSEMSGSNDQTQTTQHAQTTNPPSGSSKAPANKLDDSAFGNNETDQNNTTKHTVSGNGGSTAGNSGGKGSGGASLGATDEASTGANVQKDSGSISSTATTTGTATAAPPLTHVEVSAHTACANDRSEENKSSLRTVSNFIVKVYDAATWNPNAQPKYTIANGDDLGNGQKVDFSQIRAQLYATKATSFTLPVAAGTYYVVLCDASFASQCRLTRLWQTSFQTDTQNFNDEYQDYYDSTSDQGVYGVIGVSEVQVSMDGRGGTTTMRTMVLSDNNGSDGDDSYCDDETSPLVLDTRGPDAPPGPGFANTDLAHGIDFDIRSLGRKWHVAWLDWQAKPAQAFLALDKDHNGTIGSGDELFGNFTYFPSKNAPGATRALNGFEALKMYDANHDGRIDTNDPVWNDLVLLQGSTLTPIKNSNVEYIELDYTRVSGIFEQDRYGNLNKYRACVKVKGVPYLRPDGRCSRMVIDVYFRDEDPAWALRP